jgi:hypothetical protein
MTEITYQKRSDTAELPPPGGASLTPMELSQMVSRQAAHLHTVLKSATQLFDKIDTDHSGALSIKEIQAAMKTLPARDKEVLEELLHAQSIDVGGRRSLDPMDNRPGITRETLQKAEKSIDDAKTATIACNKAKFISSDIISKYGHDGKLNAGDLKAALDPSSTLTPIERKVLKDMQADLERHPKDTLSASALELKIRRWADNKIDTLAALNYEFNTERHLPDSPSQAPAPRAATAPDTSPARSGTDQAKSLTPSELDAIRIVTDPPYRTIPPLTIPHIVNLPDKTFVHKPIVLPLPQGQH